MGLGNTNFSAWNKLCTLHGTSVIYFLLNLWLQNSEYLVEDWEWSGKGMEEHIEISAVCIP